MEFRDIEYFAKIAEHGQLARAAEALGLGQPALSMSLRRLEKSMRTKLVRRTPKGVELTAVGSALLTHVHRLRVAREDIAREVADLSEGRAGHLRIGVTTGFPEEFVGIAGSVMLKEAAKVTLEARTINLEDLMLALREGKLDLAVTSIPAHSSAGLIHEHLIDDEYVVYASVDHRLARRRRVTIVDLAQERWAKTAATSGTWQVMSRMFDENGLAPPRIAVESDTAPVRLHAVAACGLVGFAPRIFVRQVARRFRLAVLRVRELSCYRRIGVSYRKDAYLSPAARRFIEILKITARKISEEKP